MSSRPESGTDGVHEAASKTAQWWWLLVPLAISSFPWVMVPLVLHSRGVGLEGTLFYASAAGILSTVAYAPATIIALRAIGVMPSLGFLRYAAIIFAVAVPALIFQSIWMSASAMPAFSGNWALNLPDPYGELAFAATFIVIYAIVIAATYPFARRGGSAATFAALFAGGAILLAIIIQTMARANS